MAPYTGTGIFVATGLSFNTGCFGIICCLGEVSGKPHHCHVSSGKSSELARIARNTKIWESTKEQEIENTQKGARRQEGMQVIPL